MHKRSANTVSSITTGGAVSLFVIELASLIAKVGRGGEVLRSYGKRDVSA